MSSNFSIDIIISRSHDVYMRTTVTIEDSLYERIQDFSYKKNISLKRAINMLISSGFQTLSEEKETPPFVQESFGMGKPYSEYDLIKALESAGHLEASELKRKLELRK